MMRVAQQQHQPAQQHEAGRAGCGSKGVGEQVPVYSRQGTVGRGGRSSLSRRGVVHIQWQMRELAAASVAHLHGCELGCCLHLSRRVCYLAICN
jgi:hypothetical protein